MPFWWFKEYVTDQQRCPIVDWYGMLEPEAQAAFDLTVKVLSETEDWDEVKATRRKYKELSRSHQGLCELKFKLGRRRFRPLGVLIRDNREFVFLGGCEKKGRGESDPPGAFAGALRLKKQFEEGRGRTREHIF
jgi:hypothetical protein